MSRKGLPALTDCQRELCGQVYDLVVATEAKILAHARRRGMVLDEEEVTTRLHNRLLRAAATWTGTGDFREWARRHLEGYWWVVPNRSRFAPVEEMQDVYEDVDAGFDAEIEMDDLGLTEGRDEFEQVVWRGQSVRKAYGKGEQRTWEQVKQRVAKVLS